MRVFEVNLTYRCNRRCRYCDRLRDLVTLHGDADLDQIDRLCRDMVEHDWKVGTLKLSGGEALLHPDIKEIVTRFASMPRTRIWKIRILTNGTLPKIDFSKYERVAYWDSPPQEKHHVPVLFSPTDFMVRGRFGTARPCPQIRKCGPCWDCYGFTPCPAAGAFGHGVGVNPYSRRLTVNGSEACCTHCFLSMGPQLRKAVVKAAEAGEIEHPSYAYRVGIRKLKSNPTPFPRW